MGGFPQQPVPLFSTGILEVPKGHYVEMHFNMSTSVALPCLYDTYLEVRDGHDQSADLLAIFCGNHITGIVRSSGHYMWLNFLPDRSRNYFEGYYLGKAKNETGEYYLNYCIFLY